MNDTITIVGAGISGLTLALALHARGIRQVRVLEQSKPIRELGSGINILPLAVKELAALGLLPEIETESVLLEDLDYVTWDGHKIWTENKGRKAGFLWPQASISRARLQKILLRHVSERLGHSAIIDAAKVTNIESNADVVKATCSDGRCFEASAIVGADGIRSAVRASMYPGSTFLNIGATTIYRGTVWTNGYANNKKMFIGGNGACKFVVYPIFEQCQGKEVEVNWAAAVPSEGPLHTSSANWNALAHASDVAQNFKDWQFGDLFPEQLINRTSNVYSYPMVDIDPLPSWSKGGDVVLIGDAAHGMHPIGSNGATQSIIDSISLAHSIHSSGSTRKGIQKYELDRKTIVQQIQLANRKKGPEVVIDVAAERRKAGPVLDIAFPYAERSAIALQYSRLTHATLSLVNSVSPYYLGA